MRLGGLKQRFELSHLVLVGDCGMITQARIEEDIKPAGFDWITALSAPQIRAPRRFQDLPALAVR